MPEDSLTEQQQDTSVKKLAELKAYLEKQMAGHQEEIRTLRSFLDVVDNLLAERSYRRMNIPSLTTEPSQAVGRVSGSGQSIRTMAGVHLADLFVEGFDLRIVPSETIRFDVNAPPLRTFLLGKVLESMKAKDLEAVRKQELSPDRVLSYAVDQEGSTLTQLTVKNYGDEQRLNEIRNGVRWTLRKMYEKTVGTQLGNA